MIALSQTAAFGVGAPQLPVTVGLIRHRLAGQFRSILFSLALSLLLTAMAHAEEPPQDWVPDVLALPADARVQMDRSIGSSIRMFSFTTAADVEELFRAWSEELARDGYNIRPKQAGLEETAIEFSGRDILNAKIATEPAADGDRTVITFDATLQ
ncbi:hypothetical protein [Roseovarius sp. MBR-6]|uniref:hypothetical protein n=1 Tax=Roseovarius sp. MBR-6 TaxID=3156459 RepID=UPI00339813F1